MSYQQLFIGGEWAGSTGDEAIEVFSPHSGRFVGSAPSATVADAEKAVLAASTSFETGAWRDTPVADRIATLERLATSYAKRIAQISKLVSDETGSPITYSNMAHGPGAAAVLASTIRAAKDYDWEERRTGFGGKDVIVRSAPVGVVAAIVPWNAPQYLAMAKLAPALLGGCSIVMKAATETPLDALMLAEAIEEAGFPAGVISVLTGGVDVGEYLVQHRLVDKVSFTGSTATGRRIAAVCGEQLKRVSLELGGKSAAIVLDDADIAATAAGLRFASFMNSGQACVAQTRIIVGRDRHDELVDALSAAIASFAVGDPADPSTEIGPMVSSAQQERVTGYIRSGAEEGARLVIGGVGRPDDLDTGWYVKPTLFANVDNSMRIAQEEIFGPVVSVIPCDGEADAVRIANDSVYGLGGSVWTSDTAHGVDVARRVRTGTMGINRYSSDLLAPFGGFKLSGIGRENGREGLAAYVELQSIVP